MKRCLLILMGLCITVYTMAQSIQESIARELVTNHKADIGLQDNELSNFIVSSAYYDKADNIQRIYLLQSYKGLPVYNQMIILAFRDNKLISKAGSFIGKIDSIAEYKPATPSLISTQAVQAAFTEAKITAPGSLPPVSITENGRKTNYGRSANVTEDIITELIWVPILQGKNLTVKLAWQVQVAPKGTKDWWQMRIDAATGQLIDKNNWTVYESNGIENPANSNYTGIMTQRPHQINGSPFFAPPTVTSATYLVIPFPYESPAHHAAATVTQPWLNAGAGNPAITDGWHFDGTTNYTITRGNNVYAYLDIDNINAPNTGNNLPATSTTPDPSLTFNFPPNYNQDPNVTGNKNFAITNLFYWNNLMHDVSYQYGFTEPAGNFQTDNIGRGGVGNDYVQAEGQDGGGTNNANFATPVDGNRPRMQMYLFDAVSSITFHVNTPLVIAGNYTAVESGFSTANKLAAVGPVTAPVVYFNDDATGTAHLACSGAPVNVLTGKIALIYRGTCNFTVKVLAAQTAGAVGVIMVNNAAGAPIIMGGTDNTIIIPAVMISDVDGATLAAQITNNLNVTMSGISSQRFDGDLDAGVMCHEYTHGISNRLTGGPANTSCLGNAEEGGEGWSDYMGLMMTTNWATATVNDGPLARPIGTYVEGQTPTGPGIRNYPYSTNLAINPLTYANMGTGTIGTEVHNIGEIWCMALWEMTWAIIQQENSINTNLYNYSPTVTGGNSIAIKLVLEGMKLQPCSPGYIDARNAILQADQNLYAGRHYCAIWNAFAKRGMGYSALEGSPFSATDQTAAFDLPPAPSITTQPASTSVCTGANATFTIAATGGNLTYNWQVSTDGGTTWNNVAPVATTSTLTLTGVTAGMNNNKYRCVLTAGCAPSTVNSSAATLTINTSAPVITAQPSNTTACAGTNATFTIAATGAISYNWQVSTDGGTTWNNTSPLATTTTITLTNVTSGMNNNQYRCAATGGCSGTVVVNSNGATLTISTGSVAITANPSNTTACAGANATFTVTATGAGLTYNWQVSTDGGATWNNVSPAATTSTLTLTGVTAGMNNNQYRCIVNGTGACPATGINSTAASLTVNTLPSITAQPQDASVCSGGTNTFCVTATGSNLTYQWETSTSCTGTFTNVAGATANCLTISSAVGTASYRCKVTGTCGSTLTTNCATLTVVTSVTITGQPANSTVCEGANTSFTVAGIGTGVIYQWYVSTDGGSTYTLLANTSVYSGATTATLNITGATFSMNNYRYRCQLSNSTCTTPGISNAAVLTVNTLPVITASPLSATICIGGGTTFSVTATGTSVTYQWQISTSAVPAFTNITGANASSYTVSGATAAMNGNQYRCIVSGTCTPAATSAAATLSVVSPVSITTQPGNAELCSGSNATFTVAGSSTQAIVYQWQLSTDGGTTWTNIAGANSATYTANAVTVATSNNKYRVLLSNATCTVPTVSLAGSLVVHQLPSVGLTATSTSLSPGQLATITATPTATTGGALSTTWTFNNSPLAVTGNTYIANVEKTGTYQVLIIETWPSSLACSSLSQVVTISAPGSSRLFIFPSPNNGIFTVAYYNSAGTSTSRTVTVYDSRGAKVEFKKFSITGPYTLLGLDIRPAQKGIYYVVVGDEAGKVLAKDKILIGD